MTSRNGRGTATVVAAVLAAGLVTAAVLIAAVGGAVADQRRVESAVDLGALAGAAAVQQGRPGCVAARVVVSRNGARTTSCQVDRGVVTVRAERRTRPLLGRRFAVASTARAGPAPAG